MFDLALSQPLHHRSIYMYAIYISFIDTAFVQDRDQWRDLVNAVMNLQIS